MEFLTRPGKHSALVTELLGEPDTAPAWQIWTISNGAGPTVLLMAGVHGDELEGQCKLRSLAAELTPSDITGRLIIISSLNYPAASVGQRVSPADGQNMNRVFPGSPDGTLTERVADFLVSSVFPVCDIMIDLHSGGTECRVVPMVFGFTNARCKYSENDLNDVLTAWGFPYVQHVAEEPRAACCSAPHHGVTAIEVECGGGGPVQPDDLDRMYLGLRFGLAALGVCAPALSRAATGVTQVDWSPDCDVLAPAAGAFCPCVALGDVVSEGALIGYIHAIGKEDLGQLPVKAHKSGVVLRLSVVPFSPAAGFLCSIGQTGTSA